MARRLSILFSLALTASVNAGQRPTRPPVLDMHAHLTAERGPGIMDARNIRYVLLAGDRAGFAKLETMANRHLPALAFPCPDGREPLSGRHTCYATGTEFPDIAWVRGELQAGRVRLLAKCCRT